MEAGRISLFHRSPAQAQQKVRDLLSEEEGESRKADSRTTGSAVSRQTEGKSSYWNVRYHPQASFPLSPENAGSQPYTHRPHHCHHTRQENRESLSVKLTNERDKNLPIWQVRVVLHRSRSQPGQLTVKSLLNQFGPYAQGFQRSLQFLTLKCEQTAEDHQAFEEILKVIY